ncbi:MAG: aminotransferase class I/II-fold pyridoxal phosphate-dependent enzyme [Candidatus Omnitrophota bacterium]
MIRICRARVLFSRSMLAAFLTGSFKGERAKVRVIKQFEDNFALYLGVKYAVAVSSGKIALYICLKILKAKDKDEIILPSYTVPEVVDVIIACGLRPVFVDISLEHGTMNAELVEKMIGERTKFILMTHMYGNPCNIEAILQLSQKYDLTVIEDAAQACGTEYQGKKAGTFGKLGYFSFGILKNLNTLGGGMIVTDDEVLAGSIRTYISDFKPIRKFELMKRFVTALSLSMATHPIVFSLLVYPAMYFSGYGRKNNADNFLKQPLLTPEKVEELKMLYSGEQAAMGLVQILYLDALNSKKIENADILNRYLCGHDKIRIFQENQGRRNIYLNYVIMVKGRDELIKHLFCKGIDLSPGFVVSCAHLQRFREFFNDCPNSKALEDNNLYIPIYSPLKKNHMLRISEGIRTWG